MSQTEKKGGITIKGDKKYVAGVKKALPDAKKADPALNTMITELEASKNEHEITMPTDGKGSSNDATGVRENESNGKGTGSVTCFDPTK